MERFKPSISVCPWELMLARKDFDTLLLEPVDEGVSSMRETKKMTEEIVDAIQ